MNPQEARRHDAEEFAAESAALMRRALAYAERKRADERERLMRMELTSFNDTAQQRRERTVAKIEKSARPPHMTNAVVQREVLTGAGRRPYLYAYNGKLRTIREWAEVLSIPYNTLYGRVYTGMTLAEAIETGPRPRRRHRRQTPR